MTEDEKKEVAAALRHAAAVLNEGMKVEAKVYKGDKYTWYVYNQDRATNITTKNKKHTVKLDNGSAFGVRPATSEKGMMRLVVPGKGASRVFSYDKKFVDRLIGKSKRKKGRKPLG